MNIQYIVDRLKEPSSQAAIAAVAVAVAANSTGTTQAVATAVAGIFGAAGVATAEKK